MVDKSLVRITSNIHSKSCPKGPTFTVELARGAISGTVPGDRADDRKAAGYGPGGGSTITSNRDGRFASRRIGGSCGFFVVRLRPQGSIHTSPQRGTLPILSSRGCAPRSPRNGVGRTSTRMHTSARAA